MAILKSADGKFYDVPDSQLGSLEIPADQVKQRLTEAGGAPEGGPGRGPGPRGRGGPAPQVLINVYGGARRGGFAQVGGAPAATAGQACESEVEPYGHGGHGGHHCHHCHRCHRCHNCHHCHHCFF
ncbi:MAG: hypothetical protein JNG89_20450 [Planctomycetaceae bacterium]|nr:hypothetical protein [Planctomycetaceae bacterium]